METAVGPVCALCRREGLKLTRHHLIPKTRHSNKRNKRNFDRTEVKTRLAWICRPCHTHVHHVLSEKQLEYEYNTIEALMAHPEIQKFVGWISRKPAGFKPHSRAMKDSRE